MISVRTLNGGGTKPNSTVERTRMSSGSIGSVISNTGSEGIVDSGTCCGATTYDKASVLFRRTIWCRTGMSTVGNLN